MSKKKKTPPAVEPADGESETPINANPTTTLNEAVPPESLHVATEMGHDDSSLHMETGHNDPVKAGAEAITAIKKTFYHWLVIARGVAVLHAEMGAPRPSSTKPLRRMATAFSPNSKPPL